MKHKKQGIVILLANKIYTITYAYRKVKTMSNWITNLSLLIPVNCNPIGFYLNLMGLFAAMTHYWFYNLKKEAVFLHEGR